MEAHWCLSFPPGSLPLISFFDQRSSDGTQTLPAQRWPPFPMVTSCFSHMTLFFRPLSSLDDVWEPSSTHFGSFVVVRASKCRRLPISDAGCRFEKSTSKKRKKPPTLAEPHLLLARWLIPPNAPCSFPGTLVDVVVTQPTSEASNRRGPEGMLMLTPPQPE